MSHVGFPGARVPFVLGALLVQHLLVAGVGEADSGIRRADLAPRVSRTDYFLAEASALGLPVLLCELGNSSGSQPIVVEELLPPARPRARVRYLNKLRQICTNHRDTKYSPLVSQLSEVVIPVDRNGATPISLVFDGEADSGLNVSPHMLIELNPPKFGVVTIVGNRVNYATDARYTGQAEDTFSVLYVGPQGSIEISYTIATKR